MFNSYVLFLGRTMILPSLFKINEKSDCAWIPTTHIHAMNINNPRLIHSPPIFDVKVTFFE